MLNAVSKAIVTPPSAGFNPNQTVQNLVLVNPDGSPANTSIKKQAAQANSTATDVAGLVTDFNALLAKLRAAGILS